MASKISKSDFRAYVSPRIFTLEHARKAYQGLLEQTVEDIVAKRPDEAFSFEEPEKFLIHDRYDHDQMCAVCAVLTDEKGDVIILAENQTTKRMEKMIPAYLEENDLYRIAVSVSQTTAGGAYALRGEWIEKSPLL